MTTPGSEREQIHRSILAATIANCTNPAPCPMCLRAVQRISGLLAETLPPALPVEPDHDFIEDTQGYGNCAICGKPHPDTGLILAAASVERDTTAFAPGPWKVSEEDIRDHGIYGYAVLDANGITVADHCCLQIARQIAALKPVAASVEEPQEAECVLANLMDSATPRCITHDAIPNWVECTGWRCEVSGKIITKRAPAAEPPTSKSEEPQEAKMNIILNGRTVLIGARGGLFPATAGRVSYEDIVEWAGYSPSRILSVTYSTRRGGDEQRRGSLSPGKSTEIEDGMVFNVADTSNA